jgi:RNA polymerase sigma factor (sigma-70 family)
MWCLTQTWVKSNKVLIWCIASPYVRHIPCDAHDLENEALLTAYQVLTQLIMRQKDLSLMNKYYRVVFRTQCIRLTMRIRVTDCDVDQISVTPPDSIQDEELDQEVITAALEVLTDRQREISEWILSQSTPVSTTTVSEEFGIQSRTVRAILSNAVKRIEQYGYQAVREEFAPAT